MNKEAEIERLVDKVMGLQPNTFSESWKKDLVDRIVVSDKIPPPPSDKKRNEEKNRWRMICEIYVETAHDNKFFQMVKECENWLRHRFSSALSDYDIDCIIIKATDDWREKFDANETSKWKRPELEFLKLMTRNALSDYKKRRSIQTVSIEEVNYDVEDSREYSDKSEMMRNAEAEKEELDQVFVDTNSAYSRPIKLGGKFFPYHGFTEVFRYYALTDKLIFPDYRHEIKARVVHEGGRPAYTEIIQPELKPEYQHDRDAFIKIHEQLMPNSGSIDLLNVNNTTAYYKRRWEILRASDTIRWMELAISKLRESKEKKISDLTNFKGTDSDRREIEKAPLLSSVVVCTDGRFFTCYKGQDTEPSQHANPALHWKRHCEYSLFVHVVGEENIHLLKGGTLYVTLEPCNKRNPIGIGEGEEGQPKIPCAVRCVEAGLANIYLGSFDYHERVLGKGREILETGTYRFKLINGKHVGQNDKEIRGAGLLEKYFAEKKEYPLISSSDDHRTYKIGEPTNIYLFDEELRYEVYNLNSEFQRKHKPEAFEVL